jgi:hypothetical protein
MSRGRIASLAIRAVLAIVVIALFVQIGIGFSPIYLRFVEIVLIASCVIPIGVVLLTLLGLSYAATHRRARRAWRGLYNRRSSA